VKLEEKPNDTTIHMSNLGEGKTGTVNESESLFEVALRKALETWMNELPRYLSGNPYLAL